MMAVILPDNPRPRCVSKREWNIQRKEDLRFTICDIMHTDSEIPLGLVDEYNDLTRLLNFEENASPIVNNVNLKGFINGESEKRIENLIKKAFENIKELSPFYK